MKVLVILTNGFEEMEALGTIDVLRRGGVVVDVFSLHGPTLMGAHNVKISDLENYKEADLDNYDCLFIAGGPQYQELETNSDFLNIIKYFSNKDRYIGAICAAPTILGKLGLLKGKEYTCFNSMNEDFGGTYIDHYAVKDGKLVTGKGPMATIEFALLLLETITNKNTSETVKEGSFYYHK